MRSISASIVSMLLTSNAYAFAATGIRSPKTTHPVAIQNYRAPAAALQSAVLSPDSQATQSFKSSSVQASSLISRVRKLVTKQQQGDDLTLRQKLKKSGMPVIMSFGTISNISVGGFLSVAWYIFSKRTGLSPLAPQQWKPFMVVYSACMALSRTLTPIMFAGAVALSPMWEKMLGAVQKRTNLSRGWSNCICALLVNGFGTLGVAAGGVSIAAALAGVPIM